MIKRWIGLALYAGAILPIVLAVRMGWYGYLMGFDPLGDFHAYILWVAASATMAGIGYFLRNPVPDFPETKGQKDPD